MSGSPFEMFVQAILRRYGKLHRIRSEGFGHRGIAGQPTARRPETQARQGHIHRQTVRFGVPGMRGPVHHRRKRTVMIPTADPPLGRPVQSSAQQGHKRRCGEGGKGLLDIVF